MFVCSKEKTNCPQHPEVKMSSNMMTLDEKMELVKRNLQVTSRGSSHKFAVIKNVYSV